MARWPFRARRALTADARVLQGPAPPTQVSDSQTGDPRRRLQRTPDTWQREAWDFYDSLGEFHQGVTWKANMLSRIRLRAGRRIPGQDEPELVDSGPAHDIMADLAGGVGGQSRLMRSFAVYLDVPGECYLIGETLPNEVNRWQTRSIEEVRFNQGELAYYVAEEYGRWRRLPDNCMVVRVWRPHERWHAVAESPAKAARSLMRELELINRHIAAQYLSRLASAGVIVLPDEISFPVRPEFQDAPDPFVAEWIEIAAEAIKTPGTASSVIPIPIKVPGEYVDKIRMIDFTLKLDDQIISKRDSALSRLAIALDMPAEALLGTKDVNHWNAWLVDEQGVKIHVAPTVELVCDALTTGYLIPRLQAAGEDLADWVVWYDASELVLRPDRSESAREVYDRLELSGDTLRRESGFNDSDAPTEDELRTIILKKASLQPVNTFAAMDELGYGTDHDTPTNVPRPPAQTPPPQAPPAEPGPPEGEEPTGPQPKGKNTSDELRAALTHQSKLTHALRISFDGTAEILHPRDCREHLFSCPVVHATWKPVVDALPGTPGLYQCWINSYGQPMLGKRVLNGEAADMIIGGRHAAGLPT